MTGWAPADWIRDQRLCLGRTQLELAHQLGVCEHTVARWETGVYRAPNYLWHAMMWVRRGSRQIAEIPDDFPAVVRRYREALSLSQEQMAVQLGVVRAVVGNWEKGRSQPRPFIMLALKWITRTACTPHSFASIEYNALHSRRTPKNEQFA